MNGESARLRRVCNCAYLLVGVGERAEGAEGVVRDPVRLEAGLVHAAIELLEIGVLLLGHGVDVASPGLRELVNGHDHPRCVGHGGGTDELGPAAVPLVDADLDLEHARHGVEGNLQKRLDTHAATLAYARTSSRFRITREPWGLLRRATRSAGVWGAGTPAHLVAVEAAAPKADVVGVLDRPEDVHAIHMALTKAPPSRLREGGDA